MSPFRLNGLLNGLAKTGPSVRLLKKSTLAIASPRAPA
jgi:hypothetical protein